MYINAVGQPKIEGQSPSEVEATTVGPPPRGFATINMVIAPEGVVVIFDRVRYRDDPKWKFTGGRGEPGETPIQGCLRETKEEAGVDLAEDQPHLHRTIPMRGYDIYAYVTRLPKLPRESTLRKRANEGEDVDVWPLHHIYMMADDDPYGKQNSQSRHARDFLYFQYEIFRDVIVAEIEKVAT